MQLILLLAGLILLLAVSAPWAATVGWICLAVFGVITLVQIVAFVIVAAVGASATKSPRNRRGF